MYDPLNNTLIYRYNQTNYFLQSVKKAGGTRPVWPSEMR